MEERLDELGIELKGPTITSLEERETIECDEETSSASIKIASIWYLRSIKNRSAKLEVSHKGGSSK